MLVYILLLFWPFSILLLLGSHGYNARFVLYTVAFFPTALLASLRGNTGTDTEYYRELFNGLETDLVFLDPLFWNPQILIKMIGLDFQVFALILSFTVLYLFCRGLSRIERGYPYFSISLLPVLLIDATFNGLRYGLSFALAVHIIGMMGGKVRFGGRLSLLVPALAHSSMLPLTFIRFRLSIVNLLLLSAFGYIVFNFGPIDYLLSKSELYRDLERPSSFSGLMPLIQFCVFFLIKRKYCTDSELSSSIERVALVLFLFSVAILFYSYAGLRFLQIATFLLAISIPTADSISRPRKAFLFASLLGLVTSLNFLRQILTSDGISVRFLPYELFF